MATRVKEDIAEIWKVFKQDQSDKLLRNKLMENFLPLVRYNAERVWGETSRGCRSQRSDLGRCLWIDGCHHRLRSDSRREIRNVLRPSNSRSHAR